MSTDATAARKPLTAATWADYAHQAYSPATRTRGWEADCDLTDELANISALTIEQASILMHGLAHRMPIVLTWDTNLGGRRIERTTTTVMVEYLFAPTAHHSGIVRVAYTGFAHDLNLSRVVDITEVEVTRTYREVDA